MDKRYQVFVSSTYQDLQEERQEVMHALLELDCIPSGMELFPAANESQWSLIRRVIDDCDYYVLILAGRYGSCDSDGISYTEKEYRYALSIGKPTISFLHKDIGQIAVNKSETTSEGKAKLAAFRTSVETKLCKHWASPQELGSVVSRSLVQLIKGNPAVGWIRADELPDRDATLELLRLRKRVDELESELTRTRTTAPRGTENLAQGDSEVHLHLRFDVESPGSLPDVTYVHEFSSTWNRVFAAVGPLMIHEISDNALKSTLDDFVKRETTEALWKRSALKGKKLSSFYIDKEDFQTIKIQLRALGLMAKSEKVRSLKDRQTYWTLTPYGDEIMTQLRAIKRA